MNNKLLSFIFLIIFLVTSPIYLKKLNKKAKQIVCKDIVETEEYSRILDYNDEDPNNDLKKLYRCAAQEGKRNCIKCKNHWYRVCPPLYHRLPDCRCGKDCVHLN